MQTIMDSTWFIPVLICVMAIGLIGLLTYLIPGLTIIWAAILVYGIVKGFTLWTGILFGFITVLMIGGNLIDNLMMGKEAHKSGASWWAILAALVGGVAGTLLLPPFGGLLFACAAILVIEWVRKKDFKEGLKSTGGILIGCGLAIVARFFIGALMIALWAVWHWLL